ncbi:MAG: hypothetical protein OEX00_10960 [Gammaproteobacteria bacterium]|nr:hypothetical protein [Gammaproteobacteria bacterium]MDH5692110.1 hypothetical protein [Gammaproteobacteria bacterium]
MLQEELSPLPPGLIKPDHPLLSPVYRKDGSLLAKQGALLDEEQALKILQYGELYTVRSELEKALDSLKLTEKPNKVSLDKAFKFATKFEQVEHVIEFVRDIHENSNHKNVNSMLTKAILMIMKVCAGERAPSIAKCILRQDVDVISHAVFTAIICYHCAHHMNWNERSIQSLVGAALTMNLSWKHISPDDVLPNSKGYEMLRADLAHPIRSASLLKKAGINDEAWIQFVTEHHEMGDGTGFPAKLTADSISWGGSLLALCEQYCSLVKGFLRPKQILPDKAIQNACVKQPFRYGKVNREALMAVVGEYPPGSFVELSDRTVAIVIKLHDRLGSPLVKQVMSAKGDPIRVSTLLDATHSSNNVHSAIPEYKVCVPITFESFWEQ